MKAVNAVTQVVLAKMCEVESKLAEKGKPTLIDAYNSAIKTAQNSGMSEEDAEAAAKFTTTMVVTINTVNLLKGICDAVSKTGRVICQIAAPEIAAQAIEMAEKEGLTEVVEEGRKLQDPEKLKEAAKEAASDLLTAVSLLKELMPAVGMLVEDEAVAEGLIREGKKRKESQTQVKAKPVSGTVAPFGRRIEPSQN
ncbi:hypothetical protein EBZ39_05895 [bacterium]|nr:hypothetical protein [bacterium]